MAGSLIVVGFVALTLYLFSQIDTADDSRSNNDHNKSNDDHNKNNNRINNNKNDDGKNTDNDLVADIFLAVIKLTPDLHVSGDNLKERIGEYATKALTSIDGPAGITRAVRFKDRINRKEQIKVKELQKKVADNLKGYEFQYKKEILIGMWSLAYADGQATVDQQKLISIIGKAMGLSFTACNRVETMFWQRMKSGKFGDYKEFVSRRNKWFEDEDVRKAEKEFEKKRRENTKSNESSKKQTYTYVSPELQKAYTVLGLEPSASIDDINRQKRILLKRFHPDLFANQGEEMIKKATLKAQTINNAYGLIMESK